MNMPPSRLLMRLDAAIAAEPDPVKADCLRAEQATYMARQGRRDDARAMLDELHRRYDTRPRVETSAWINLAEGMVDFCCGAGTTTHDRILRAHALSTAAGLAPMRGLTAAWLAHVEYTRLNVESVARYVEIALQVAAPDHHAARSRTNLVVAQSLHLAARLDLAGPWYQRAREHANREGDEETISALMFNMAGVRFAHLRQVILTGQGHPDQAAHALSGAESTRNFDILVGSVGLDTSVPLLQAQLLTLHGKPTEALDLYKKHIAASVHQRQERLQSYMLSDQAWCEAQLGLTEAARQHVEAAIANLTAETQVDDRAATHSRVAQVLKQLGDDGGSSTHDALASVAWADYSQLQSRIVELLAVQSA